MFSPTLECCDLVKLSDTMKCKKIDCEESKEIPKKNVDYRLLKRKAIASGNETRLADGDMKDLKLTRSLVFLFPPLLCKIYERILFAFVRDGTGWGLFPVHFLDLSRHLSGDP